MPTKEQVKQVRLDAGLSQTEAARLVSSSLRTWQYWEAGTFKMPAAKWELFQNKVSRARKG